MQYTVILGLLLYLASYSDIHMYVYVISFIINNQPQKMSFLHFKYDEDNSLLF